MRACVRACVQNDLTNFINVVFFIASLMMERTPYVCLHAHTTAHTPIPFNKKKYTGTEPSSTASVVLNQGSSCRDSRAADGVDWG